jgi:serpin B
MIAALAFATLSGCDASPSLPGNMQHSSIARAVAQPANSPDVVQASSDNAAFALALYATARTPNSNLFLSPWSITSALAMTYAGASGTTSTEMATALHFTLPPERLHAALNSIDAIVTGDAAHPRTGNPITWREANGLFAQDGQTLLTPFLDALAANYGAGVSLMNFATDFDRSREAINGWVGAVTNGHIPALFAPGSITASTRFVLANAVYLDAAWQRGSTRATRGWPRSTARTEATRP